MGQLSLAEVDTYWRMGKLSLAEVDTYWRMGKLSLAEWEKSSGMPSFRGPRVVIYLRPI
jgi:hypothetical protein